MREIPIVKWYGEPCFTDWHGYSYTISADERDNIVTWMCEAEDKIKELRQEVEDWKDAAGFPI